MKYMILMNYAPVPGIPPMNEWTPEDIQASGAAMGAIHAGADNRAGNWSAPKGWPGPEAASS